MLTKNALLALFLLPVFFFLRYYHESWPLLANPQVVLLVVLIYVIAMLSYYLIIRMGIPPIKSSLTLFLPGFSLLAVEPLNHFLAHLTHNSPAVGLQFIVPVWIILNVLVIRKLLVMNSRLFRRALWVNLGVILLLIFELFLGIKNSSETRRNNMAVTGKDRLGLTLDSKANPKSVKLPGETFFYPPRADQKRMLESS